MHDIRAIRDNFDAFKAGIGRRALSDEQKAQIDSLIDLDTKLRAATTKKQEAEAARNAASKQIGAAKAKKDEAEAARLMAEVATLKETIESAGAEEAVLQKQTHDILAALPNIPADDVPLGADEEANVEKARWAPTKRLPAQSVDEPRDHVALGEGLGMMDFEAAARMSGARFVVLKQGLARMERALAAFMIDMHTEEYGYSEIAPPILVREQAMFGTGQLPKFASDLFEVLWEYQTARAEYSSKNALNDLRGKTVRRIGEINQVFGESMKTAIASGVDARWAGEGFDKLAAFFAAEVQAFKENGREFAAFKERFEDIAKSGGGRFFLTPTAEVSMTNIVMQRIIDEDALPMRMTADTPCFRSEAGAAGKDTRGMIRMHQFRKVELVSITTPEESEAEHERMTNCAEEVLRRLDLPFRRILLCTGDMGFSAQKTYDLEVWLPSQNKYREISSCSNCGDFQARRMNARYRGKDGKVKGFVHTLNGSGLAVGRTLVAILENYQNADGSITIPDALRPYMGGKAKLSA
jgi:seryl-tRNA synthetase